MFRKSDTHIHFVGIGGIGMSGIAEVLLNSSYRVTGTDLVESDTTRRLVKLGATIHYGHRAEHLADADVVVVSSAVHTDNPEIVAALARRIPVIPRAEMLAELMRLKQGIAIAGSHGKTTTTSLIASILHAAGLDPTMVIGGKVNSFDSNARLGTGDLLVVEADESDGSFLYLTPTHAVVTNIDNEHLDHYTHIDRLLDAFVGFANRVPFHGVSVLCHDDAHVASILPRIGKRFVTYGLGEGADYVAVDLRHVGATMRFRVRAHERDLGEFELHMPGKHNVLNALASIAMCDVHEVPSEISRQAIGAFSGVQRRFTMVGSEHDVLVVDDYGHHPTEIRATLAGARASYPERRIVGVIQPHRYTRLAANMDGFVACMDDADVVVVTEVYAAGELPLAGVDGDALATKLRARTPKRTVVYAPDFAALPQHIVDFARPGDVVITLGAGSVTRIGPSLLELLRRRAGK